MAFLGIITLYHEQFMLFFSWSFSSRFEAGSLDPYLPYTDDKCPLMHLPDIRTNFICKDYAHIFKATIYSDGNKFATWMNRVQLVYGDL